MATTMLEVFNLTMALIDEINQNSGAVEIDSKEYKVKTPLILNILRGELYPYSDTYSVATKGKRPVCPKLKTYTEDSSLSSEIGLDDFICQTIMPYGLAAHLMLTEDAASASFFNQRYEELIQKFRSSIPNDFEEIENVYGYPYGFEHNWYSRW